MRRNWQAGIAGLCAAILLAGPVEAARPRFVAKLGGARCKGPGIVNEAAGVADLTLICKGIGKRFRKGTLRLVYGDSFLDGARLVAPGYDCVYLGSYLLGTGCDALFNCRFDSEDASCDVGGGLDIETTRKR